MCVCVYIYISVEIDICNYAIISGSVSRHIYCIYSDVTTPKKFVMFDRVCTVVRNVSE